jgi:hypothetical protein
MEDETRVPFTGLAIVIFDARADSLNISPDSVAKKSEATGCLGVGIVREQVLLKKNINLLRGWA